MNRSHAGFRTLRFQLDEGSFSKEKQIREGERILAEEKQTWREAERRS
jgi:hypothetical protein